ncbi:hypothetical protein P167DRAFT_423701 [Morchella conica CCBAS932]|uniref:Ribosome assembly protein 3 n=1 Tax=Morchella conica CCBAS932 TaxID=1392247 RepID=A0A3N4KMZ8_9PEZI|nr:hypothetical protein P167DRAFT_423701 [Morchella conica CCBAS932]
MENIEKARKTGKVAAAPPGRKTANSSSSSSIAAEHTPKSSPHQTTSKEPTTTRMKPVTRGQTEQAAPRRRLTNNSNQTSIASIADSGPTAKNPGHKNAGVSTPTFIKIDDDTASEGEASDRDVREVESKAKSPPQTRTQSKHTTPASVTRSSTSKKRSTPPPSSSSIDTEDTYQPKRPRTQQSEREREREREEEEGDEESNPRADLEAFANSLERLSRLLFAARDNLSRKQVGVLENDIHHDWKVDEMSTFVEGFLRGADALDGRLKD